MSTKEEIKEFKIITLGDSGVGKTPIIKRFCENKFDNNNQSTIGINFSRKELIFDKKNKIILKLIDTAGQEKYKSLAKSYFKHVDVVLFVFSMNDIESFGTINAWMELFKENNNKEDIPKYLVGTKNDLDITVEQNLIEEFLQKNKITFMSTSSKKNNNIDELFKEIGEKLYLNISDKEDLKQNNIKIDNLKAKRRNRCCDVFGPEL